MGLVILFLKGTIIRVRKFLQWTYRGYSVTSYCEHIVDLFSFANDMLKQPFNSSITPAISLKHLSLEVQLYLK